MQPMPPTMQPMHNQALPPQPMPAVTPTGVMPMNPAPAPLSGGPMYPGAAGGGITEMSPGVQSVTGAMAGNPKFQPGPHIPNGPHSFDPQAFQAAIQQWRATRPDFQGGPDRSAIQNWRSQRPMPSAYPMAQPATAIAPTGVMPLNPNG